MSAKVKKLDLSSRYDAAQPSPYHLPPPASEHPDQEWSYAGRQLRDWARHLANNSAIAASILSSRVTNGIGKGLTYEPMVRNRQGELIPEINDPLRAYHQKWSVAADVSGELSRQQIEALAWRGWDTDGESFIRDLIFPDGFRVELIPPEWIPEGYTGQIDGERYSHGIIKDAFDRPQQYLVLPSDTGTYIYMPELRNAMRLPSDQVTHLKRVTRPRQTRGITLLHAVILRIADVAEYQQSHRLAARASADLWASINRAAETDPDVKRDSEMIFDRLQVIDGLTPGESVNFHEPAHPNQNAVDFVNQELRAIAAATDTGFSQIAQVYDRSYSAQRLEVVDTWRRTLRDRQIFIDRFARPTLYEKPINFAFLTNVVTARALRRADPSTLMDVRIDGPPMPVIDPVKDRTALEKDQQNGWDSRQGIIRTLGRVPGDVDAERNNDMFIEESIDE